MLVGCGALGSSIALHLARSGVGHLLVIDRDLVDLTNLHRQILFTEADAAAATPKAIAAANALRQMNSQISVEAMAIDFHSGNAEQIFASFRPKLILDGTDNAQTRYLINDLAVKHGTPWVYGGCVGVEGRVMAIIPGQTCCLRCLFPTPPQPGELATCDTSGVLGPAAAIVGAAQAAAGLRLLVEGATGHSSIMLALDAWTMQFRSISVADARREDCPCCGKGDFEFLARPVEADAAAFCGRNAVQIRSAALADIDLARLAERLAASTRVQNLGIMLRCELPDAVRLTIFADGRVIVDGTNDISRARSLVSRYVGV